MKHLIKRWALVLGCGVLAVVVAGRLALAAQGGYHVLSWSSHSGGSSSAGGIYQAMGSAGQPATDRLAGGQFVIRSGFWTPEGREFRLYVPLVR
jgi:hypothetical protein